MLGFKNVGGKNEVCWLHGCQNPQNSKTKEMWSCNEIGMIFSSVIWCDVRAVC